MKGKKIVLCMLLTLFVAAVQHSYAQQTQFGLKGGVTYYKGTVSGGGFEQTTDPAIGFSGGLFAEFAISEHFSIQPEALFIQKNSSSDSFAGEITTTMNYVDVPVLVKFNIPLESDVTPFLNAGGYAGYLISAATKMDGDSEDITDELNEINYGIIAGAGVKFGSISVEARYDMGLANLYSDDEIDGDVFDIKATTSGFSVYISIGF